VRHWCVGEPFCAEPHLPLHLEHNTRRMASGSRLPLLFDNSIWTIVSASTAWKWEVGLAWQYYPTSCTLGFCFALHHDALWRGDWEVAEEYCVWIATCLHTHTCLRQLVEQLGSATYRVFPRSVDHPEFSWGVVMK